MLTTWLLWRWAYWDIITFKGNVSPDFRPMLLRINPTYVLTNTDISNQFTGEITYPQPIHRWNYLSETNSPVNYLSVTNSPVKLHIRNQFTGELHIRNQFTGEFHRWIGLANLTSVETELVGNFHKPLLLSNELDVIMWPPTTLL
jgi:hypothetical protein